MPFTTMNNYNWLLNVENVEQNAMPNRDYQQAPMPELYPANIGGSWSGQHRPSQNQDILGLSAITASLQDAALLSGISNSNEAVSTMTERFQIHFTQATGNEGPQASSTRNLTNGEESSGSNSNQYRANSTSQKSASEYQRTPPRSTSSRLQQRNTATSQLQAFRSSANSKNLPKVDEVSRAQILDIVVQCGPQTPDGSTITRDHPLLTLSALQNYCDLFFSRFNVSYPLLHQATFETSQVDPLLLISIILLGATYADKASHRLAVCIHDELRAKIFQNAAFKAQPTLWMLQTILLVECFGKSRAGQTQHDMAHLFHGLLIKYVTINLFIYLCYILTYILV